VKTGDVLAIPYAGDRAVYGWALFVPKKGVPSPGLGVCMAVLDRDVRAGDDLEDVVRSRILLGPLHPNDAEIREGLWRIVGNVQGDFDALLPRFEVTKRKGTAWVSVILDYAQNEVPDTPENRMRLREQSVGGARWVMSAARALRGDARWLDGYDRLLPRGEKRP
jgi:hypothetical protein